MGNERSPAPLVLIRGLPGSGKSTFASMLSAEYKRLMLGRMVEVLDGNSPFLVDGVGLFETDDFFITVPGYEYAFDHELLDVAHNWNLGRVAMFCRDNPHSVCIVANTFCRLSSLAPYAILAKHLGRRVVVFQMETPHDSVHGVPENALSDMAEAWEPTEPPYAIRIVDDGRKEQLARMFVKDITCPSTPNATGVDNRMTVCYTDGANEEKANK